MKQFHYRAYGLTFASEFEIRGLSACVDAQADVIFQRRKLDIGQYNVKKGFLIREWTPDGFLFCVKDVAAFLIGSGKTILIQPFIEEQAVWEMLLLGPVMVALLQQNGFLTLHGSAFLNGKEAVLMLGPSGVGKSSLAMAIHQKSYPLLTDDICAINFSHEDEPLLYLGSGYTDLWEDSIEALGLSQHSSLPIRQGLSRHRFNMNLANLNKCYPVKHVYILKVGPLRKLSINTQMVDSLTSTKLLNRNLLGKNSLREMKLEQESFKMIHKMAVQISCTRLIRRQAQMDIKLVSEYLESHLKS